MKQTLEKITLAILPFLILGVALVLFMIGLIVFAYILFYGAIVGLVLFGLTYIYLKLTKKKVTKFFIHNSRDRIIDHDEEDKK